MYRIRAIFPVLLVLFAGAADAQSFFAGAGKPFGPEVAVTSQTPAYAYWNGSGGPVVRISRGEADFGLDRVYSRNEHYTTAVFQAPCAGVASFELQDLLFSSASSGTVSVGVHLTISGDYSQTGPQGVLLSLLASSGPIGTADSNGNSSGLLTGYSMQGAHELTYFFNVQLNTPMNFRVDAKLTADTSFNGNKCQGEYEVRFGGFTPVSGSTYEVFDLPAGVTVDSVQGGVTNNLWTPPTNLHLTADDPTPGPGDTVDLTTWNGLALQPVWFFVTEVNGSPFVKFIKTSSLDANGRWRFGPITNDPSLAGISAKFLSASLDGVGAFLVSEETAISFQ